MPFHSISSSAPEYTCTFEVGLLVVQVKSSLMTSDFVLINSFSEVQLKLKYLPPLNTGIQKRGSSPELMVNMSLKMFMNKCVCG